MLLRNNYCKVGSVHNTVMMLPTRCKQCTNKPCIVRATVYACECHCQSILSYNSSHNTS